MEVSLVDVAARPPAPTELQRFIQRLGATALERLIDDPRLLRLPLVRMGERASAGPDEPAWRRRIAEDRR